MRRVVNDINGINIHIYKSGIKEALYKDRKGKTIQSQS